MPRPSQRRYSSSASSNRSAAIFGSQYLLGRLPRTESARSRTSCGTNGYGFSFRYQACMRSLLQERDDAVDEDVGLLQLRMMSGTLDQIEARAGDRGTVRAPVVGRHDPVTGAPQHEGRDSDPAEPGAELRVVQVRVPRVAAERLAVAMVGDQRLVRHRVEVRLPALGIVPAPSMHVLRRSVEDVIDVRDVGWADLDPD